MTTPRDIWADTTVVCRCEEVSAAVIREAISEGATTLNDVKRRTRAGMGACQGIFCMRLVGAMLQREAGVELESLRPMTTRPPARMIALQALANIEED